MHIMNIFPRNEVRKSANEPKQISGPGSLRLTGSEAEVAGLIPTAGEQTLDRSVNAATLWVEAETVVLEQEVTRISCSCGGASTIRTRVEGSHRPPLFTTTVF